MNGSFEYGRPESDADRAALGEILRRTFHFPVERVPVYFDAAGHDNLRVIRRGAEVVGGLVIVRMGQFYGGRSVKMAGIAAVGIDQHVRGLGAASVLMREVAADMREMGFPLSALYPATQPVYRRAGYEQAGTFYRCHLSTGEIDSRQRDAVVRPITEADQSAVERAYRARATHVNGQLDRGPYVWSRVVNHRGSAARGFLVEGEKGVEGYVYVVQQDASSRPYNLYCTDLVALTQRAAMRLLKFFADHRSMAGEVIWHGSPTDALHLNLREQHIRDEVKDLWMLRLLDPAAAFEARSYAPSVTADLHLHIREDEALPMNNGPLLVRIAAGRAQAQPGKGRGDVVLSVRALASLYSGFITPRQAREAGWLDGPDDALDALGAALAGGSPWIADHF